MCLQNCKTACRIKKICENPRYLRYPCSHLLNMSYLFFCDSFLNGAHRLTVAPCFSLFRKNKRHTSAPYPTTKKTNRFTAKLTVSQKYRLYKWVVLRQFLFVYLVIKIIHRFVNRLHFYGRF